MCTLPKRECVTLKNALALNHIICILPTGLGEGMYFFPAGFGCVRNKCIWMDVWMDGFLLFCTFYTFHNFYEFHKTI